MTPARGRTPGRGLANVARMVVCADCRLEIADRMSYSTTRLVLQDCSYERVRLGDEARQ